MSAHQYDEGHTVAGWTGFGIATVGTAVAGGMFVSTFLNLVFIPVLYVIIEGWREHGKKAKAPVVASA